MKRYFMTEEEFELVIGLDDEETKKHAMHDQKSHGRRGAKTFFDGGGTISNRLDAEKDRTIIESAFDTVDMMTDMLGEEFENDKGVMYTSNALDTALTEGHAARIAATEDGLAGAISYDIRDAETASALQSMVDIPKEDQVGPHIYISYLGSTGLTKGAGSALAQSVFEEAASRNMGVMLQTVPESKAFWEKMGVTDKIEFFYEAMNYASPEKVKELVGQ